MGLIEDQVLVELHRAAALAGRPGIAVPSRDLGIADEVTGSRARSQEALGRLARKGQLTAVRKDLLVLPDVTGRVTAGLDQLIDAVAPEPYLITGGRALEHHRLTDQHYFSIPVLVPSRVTMLMYRGERAVFLATSPEHIWGWVDDEHPRYATPERVIVDVVDSPRYSVAFSQVVSALNLAVRRDPELLERLVEVLGRLRSAAAARRVGLLVDRLFGADAAAPFRPLIGQSRTPVLLRRGGVTHGQVDPTWRVTVNATTELEERDR
jgi:predicted transcriptional regulator of viral defense system